MKIDVHQHLWTEPLVEALASREKLPFIRHEHGLTVLYLAGERPYVIDVAAETASQRSALVERDGIDQALICLSSPLGIESLPREESRPLIEAYHDGALSIDGPFAVWAAVALDRPDPDDAERALERGCVGVSLPGGAVRDVMALDHVRPLLGRLEELQAPLLVHPGPGPGLSRSPVAREPALGDPLWWTALTRYVADMQHAWLAFLAAGRLHHPELRVIFTMLAGLAPLHAERLLSRGGPAVPADPLIFYDTSSYGPAAVRLMAQAVGGEQILYGSDRPVVEPGDHCMPSELDWELIADGTRRALGVAPKVVAR
jgi:hypothetical protein